MHSKRGYSVWMLAVVLSLASACDDGDDGNNDNEAGDGDGTAGDGDGDKDPTGDGDGDATGDGDPTGAEMGGDFGEGGELMGCALHETAEDCMAAADCAVVNGKPLVDDGNGSWCTETTEEFIGCASAADLCPALGKTLCDGDNYWRTTACVPDNLDVCEAPGEITGDC